MTNISKMDIDINNKASLRAKALVEDFLHTLMIPNPEGAGATPEESVVYSIGTLYGAWPSPIGNRA